MTAPGPPTLGRGVVVGRDGAAPEGWDGAERVVVDDAVVDDPSPTVERLHAAWAARRPVVVELAVDPDRLRAAERTTGPVHALPPDLDFPLERLHFLVWANTYDARSGVPVWWHGRKLARLLADEGVVEEGPADVRDGADRPWWVDGGPPDPPDPGDGHRVVHRWSAEAGVLRAAAHPPPPDGLAPDQLAAVVHPSGPVRVIAPAGSGKTRVLTERLRLLVARGAAPASVTAVAYNTRAADELRGRATDALTPAGPHVRTLNSLGLWVCRSFGGHPSLRVVDEAAVRDLVQEVFEVRRQANADTVAPYVTALSTVRLGLRSPADVEDEQPDAAGLADGFDRYRELLADRGVVDFDEQIYRAVEVLCTDPGARAAARTRCRRLLVDEFQDLTPAHVLLLRLLAAPGFDVFGVGDDDQVIYGYSGASPTFLIDFPRYFPGAAHHPLEVNYRCPPAVVDAARHLLSYNRVRLDKAVRVPAGRGDAVDGPLGGEGPLVVRSVPGDAVAATTVEVVRTWLDGGVDPSDVAVLARVNAALLPVQVACQESGVPCATPLGPAVLQRTGIRTALAYLRIGADPGHVRREDVRETVRRPARRLAPAVVEMLTRRSHTSVADVRRLAARLDGRDVPKLEAYADDLERVAAAVGRSTAEALAVIRTGIGLGETMDSLDVSKGQADRSTHGDDLVALESVAALHPDAATFAHWLREVLDRPAADGPTVLLSTVHRIKGKEWDRVVVHGVTDGLLPHRLSDDEEGERRVFHVALTRAVSQVVVVADEGAPSPFVAELDGSRPHRPVRAPAPAPGRPAPGRPSSGTTGPTGPVEAALRSWRSGVARADGVPAYVVLNDRELVGIAERRPGTLAELAACRGMGPVRLERWGDELLAVLEAAGRP